MKTTQAIITSADFSRALTEFKNDGLLVRGWVKLGNDVVEFTVEPVRH